MKAKEAVKEIMSQKEIGPSVLASRMGKSPRLVSDLLNKMENISIDKLNEMLRALDYKIMIVPRSRTKKSGEYEVE